VSIPPFGAGIFKESRSTDPMRIWKQRKEQVPALPFIVSDEPTRLPLGLRPRRARFRFARQDHCSSTTSIRLNFWMSRYTPLGRRDAGGAIPKPLATMKYRSALSEAHAASFSDLLLRRSASRSGAKSGAERC
jgi:hypothetical protein